MIAWTNTTRKGAPVPREIPALDAHTTGLIAGTKVATNAGWHPIEMIQPGQLVLTFDGGMQPVIAITRHVLAADRADPASWPLHVPSGALGNRADMRILPHQSVLIESDTAEELTGDPFALIPAAALDGFHNIAPAHTSDWVEVIQLHFAADEIVFANIGALFLCRAQADLMSDAGPSTYEVLPMDIADDLVECLMIPNDTGVKTAAA